MNFFINNIAMLKLLLVVCFCVGSFGLSWNPTGRRSPAAQQVEFRLQLLKNNPQWLDETLEAVSDPKSKEYEIYRTNEDIRSNIGRSDSEIRQITLWFRKQCFELCPLRGKAMIHGDFIQISTCTARFECIFDTQLVQYKHPLYDSFIYHSKDTSYDLQKRLKELNAPAVVRDLVLNVNNVGRLPPALKKFSSGFPYQGVKVTPVVVAENYGTKGFQNDRSSDGGQLGNAFAEFGKQYFFPSDIAAIQSHYNLPNNSIAHIVGNNDPNAFGSQYLECTLDATYLSSVADQPTWGIFETSFQYDFVAFTQTLMNTANCPKIISISYGAPESDFGEDNMNTVDDEFKKLGILKFTLFFSSGDTGVGNTLDSVFACGKYETNYPAASPYVVAVGGTYLRKTGNSEEGVWRYGGSGFSNHNRRPSWQDSAVTKYLSTAQNLPDSSKYNNTGRALPDVSAYATNCRIIVQGKIQYIGGTSASAPITASVFTYVNVQRLKNGKGPMGYITPQLYTSGGDVGQDVAYGFNEQTTGGDLNLECANAFPATSGWDAASGFGSVNLQKLLTILA